MTAPTLSHLAVGNRHGRAYREAADRLRAQGLPVVTLRRSRSVSSVTVDLAARGPWSPDERAQVEALLPRSRVEGRRLVGAALWTLRGLAIEGLPHGVAEALAQAIVRVLTPGSVRDPPGGPAPFSLTLSIRGGAAIHACTRSN